MSVLLLIGQLALFAFIVYLIIRYIPMTPQFSKLIQVVAIIGAIWWVLNSLGIWSYIVSLAKSIHF